MGWGEAQKPAERLGIVQLEDKVARLERTIADRDATIVRLRAELALAQTNLASCGGMLASPRPPNTVTCDGGDLQREARP